MDSYLALPDGAGRFRQDFTGPALLRNPARRTWLRLQGFHPLWLRFPTHSTRRTCPSAGPTTPACMHTGLGCSPSARRYSGNHYCFLFLRLLRCFSSPGWPLFRVLSGCPIRKSVDQGLFAAPHRLSQLCTSFIAGPCLGIQPVPLVTYADRLAPPA